MQTTTEHVVNRGEGGAFARRLLLALTLLIGGAVLASCQPDEGGAGTTPAASAGATEPSGTEDGAAATEPAGTEATGTSDAAEGDATASDVDAGVEESEPAPDAPEAPDDAPTDADAAAAPESPSTPESPYLVVPPLTESPQTSFDAAEDVLQPGADYLARIVTSKGAMTVELYEDRVPETVNNFVFLALHRFYDGVPFHRVLEDFMAQTGDPTGTGRGGPGYRFEDEIDPELSHDSAGVLSMANAGPNTNGSQFFITFTATPWLDGKHAVFGRVTEGMDVLDELTRVSPDEPQAVATLDQPISAVADQGVQLSGPAGQTLAERLESALGTVPVAGQSFTVDGYRGVIGRVGDQPAVGFFPQPDRIEHVEILTKRPASE